jgi:hypothetical protein
VGGSCYNWTPNANVPVDQNVLKIIDLDDQEPNYSLSFSIKGANASYVSPEDPLLDGSDSTSGNPGDTSPSSKAGLSTTAKVALAVAIPVVVIVVGICTGLWLRSKRDEARRGIILFVQCQQTTPQHDTNLSTRTTQPRYDKNYTPTLLQDSLPLRSSSSVKKKSTQH